MWDMPRSFNIDQDEHPVKYVVENLKDGIYESIYDWLIEFANGDINCKMPDPKACTIPDPRCCTS